jgi:hypothetical protein
MSYDCHRFVDKLLLTEALISNAISMRNLPALWPCGCRLQRGGHFAVEGVRDLGTLIECV